MKKNYNYTIAIITNMKTKITITFIAGMKSKIKIAQLQS